MKTSHQILQTIKILVLALILAVGIQYAVAESPWISAPNDPPNHNVDAPLNVGTTFQVKAGHLHINTTTTNPDPFGISVWQGIKSISTVPGAARIVSDERGDASTNYSGFEVKNAAGTQGGFFKKGVSNDIVISNKTGPVITVKQDGLTEIAGQLKIAGGSPADGYVLTSDANGLASWKQAASGGGAAGVYVVVQKFNTKYSTVMADDAFYDWVDTPSMPRNGSDDKGWYIRANDTKFQNTKDRLCKFFVQNGRAVGAWTGADYGSDNNNYAFYWDPAASVWRSEGHGDNGAIDITSLICAGDGIYDRALKFLI